MAGAHRREPIALAVAVAQVVALALRAGGSFSSMRVPRKSVVTAVPTPLTRQLPRKVVVMHCQGQAARGGSKAGDQVGALGKTVQVQTPLAVAVVGVSGGDGNQHSGGSGGKAVEDSGNTYTLTNNGTVYGTT